MELDLPSERAGGLIPDFTEFFVQGRLDFANWPYANNVWSSDCDEWCRCSRRAARIAAVSSWCQLQAGRWQKGNAQRRA